MRRRSIIMTYKITGTENKKFQAASEIRVSPPEG